VKDIVLFEKMLELPKAWRVSALEPDFKERTITVRLEWSGKESPVCPDCDEKCSIYDHRTERVWRHLDTMQFKTLITARVPRIKCDVHGVKTVRTPWALDGSRFTVLFEKFAIDVLLSCKTVEQAADLMGLSWDQIHSIQKRAVTRGLGRRADHDIPAIGVDEKQFQKGQDYASVLYNINKGTVIGLVRGRDEDATKQLMYSLSEGARSCVNVVAMDMWKAYENVAKDAFPEADIVFDKFHIMKHCNEAIDQVRRSELKELKEKGYAEILKGARYAALKDDENRTDEEKWRFKIIKEAELKTARAVAIRDSLKHFWDYSYEGSARKFFASWFWWATHCRLKPIIKVAHMINRRFDNVITWTKWRVTNAVAEGINSKIQVIRASARGYRNFENFRIAVLFHCGGLSLYPGPDNV
jgi:transposase